MARYSFYALPEASISISGGQQLDGITQGDGSHLVGETITLNALDFVEIFVKDGGSDEFFDDNDNNQRLDGAQSFGGQTYGNSTQIEAEYQVVLKDAGTGTEYTALSVNFDDSAPRYGTVEGLAFVDSVPPTGTPLQVVSAAEGPGSFGQPRADEATIVPICFGAGTRIDTPQGPRPVEALAAGDAVLTLDRGACPVLLTHARAYDAGHFAARPRHAPVRIEAGALAPGIPATALVLSPQHRVMLRAAAAERMFGAPEVLAPAAQLIGWPGISRAATGDGVRYVHVLLDHHAVLSAEGAPAESLLFGPAAETSLPAQACAALARRGALPAPMRPAREIVRGKGLRQLLNRLARNGHPLVTPARRLCPAS